MLLTYIAISVVAVIVGFILGFIVAANRQQNQDDASTNKSATDNEAQELRRHLATYFDHMANTTAKLHQEMDALKAQLIDSAQQIADIDVKPNFDVQRDVGHSAPPRDWAPKSANSVGTLSEEYGLKDELSTPNQT
jgi:uncharacterized membrane-anchored protein YhcB (DUF1043 family)